MSKQVFAAISMVICTLLALMSMTSFWGPEGNPSVRQLVLPFCVGGAFVGWFLLSRAIGHKSNQYFAICAGIICAFLVIPVSGLFLGLIAVVTSSEPRMLFGYILLYAVAGIYMVSVR